MITYTLRDTFLHINFYFPIHIRMDLGSLMQNTKLTRFGGDRIRISNGLTWRW